uniref:Hsp70 n=1 Tax=Ganoderma boninense TaxID=34458 RepID=A0A5K1K7M3_9APHY|nr:Hsp70 [Ganoderma boninense]
MSAENVPLQQGQNAPLQQGQKRPSDDSALTLPPRRRAGPPDYWKRKGRHVGRTIHTFVNMAQLIVAGIQLDKELSLSPDNGIEKYPADIRHQHQIYLQVLRFLPDLEEGLVNETINTERLTLICDRLQEGVNAARSDDVKGVKHSIIDWITDPEKGLAPAIDQQPWIGFLRGRLLVNGFKHVFTSPSSVKDSCRSTKSSNSALHGMTKVTVASIVYIATLVRFGLGSRSTFNRNDTVTESEAFYNVLLAFLTHPAEREKVNELLAWWNQRVFPHAVALFRAPTVNGAHAMLLADRKKRQALATLAANASG